MRAHDIFVSSNFTFAITYPTDASSATFYHSIIVLDWELILGDIRFLVLIYLSLSTLGNVIVTGGLKDVFKAKVLCETL
jgi:hypothetical protein